MKKLILALVLFTGLSQAFAQQSDDDYRKVIYGRSETIAKASIFKTKLNTTLYWN